MKKDEKNEQKKPKLVLRKESLRQLTTKDLANVRGNSEEVPESGTKLMKAQ
ncbi:MAG TPA: hypothetical protein VHB97_20120 [Polyangia bacterium]|jgi:hypothetical protein|nr:hypothetical protein [Polyangia bacterium]